MIKLKDLLENKEPAIVGGEVIDLDGHVLHRIPLRTMQQSDWHHSLYVPAQYQDSDGRYRLKFLYSDGSSKICTDDNFGAI